MLYRIKEHMKTALFNTLAYAFNSNADFKWQADISRTKIFITKFWPYEVTKLPMLVITTSTGDALMRVMQDELWEEDHKKVVENNITYDGISGYRYGGGFNQNVSIDVVTEDTITREKILDWVIMYLRWLYITKLREYGLELKNITIKGETQKQVGADYVYFDGLNLEFYTEWTEELVLAEAERIKAFDLNGVVLSMYDGTTTS